MIKDRRNDLILMKSCKFQILRYSEGGMNNRFISENISFFFSLMVHTGSALMIAYDLRARTHTCIACQFKIMYIKDHIFMCDAKFGTNCDVA